jgi:predicted transcriptional regulator
MPQKRRSRLEVVADILQTLSAGCKSPTRVSTETNLAYDRMVKIVETLMERGVVKEDGGLLCITPEGLKFLNAYRQWRRFLDALGL